MHTSFDCSMRYFDSHVHLADPLLLPEAKEVLARAKSAGVQHCINIATTPDELKEGLKLAAEFPFILNAGATPPHTVEEEGEDAFPHFAAAAQRGQLYAIGETGLDYHNVKTPREIQIRFLKRYLHLAAQVKRPIIFHCRDAFSDLYEVVDAEYPKGSPAVLHCFTGTWEEAKGVLDRGWFLSLSGIVTFKKSTALQEIAKKVPLNQLLIETDAPFLAPQSRRGKRNEPAFLPETAACIAALQGVSLETIAEQTFVNAESLFYLTN